MNAVALSGVVALLLAVLSLVGCGGGDQAPRDQAQFAGTSSFHQVVNELCYAVTERIFADAQAAASARDAYAALLAGERIGLRKLRSITPPEGERAPYARMLAALAKRHRWGRQVLATFDDHRARAPFQRRRFEQVQIAGRLARALRIDQCPYM